MALGLVAFLLGATKTSAEEACIKYHKCISLDAFKCEEVTRSSLVRRLCYAELQRYLVIWLGKKSTPYDYCEGGPDDLRVFKDAESMGRC